MFVSEVAKGKIHCFNLRYLPQKEMAMHFPSAILFDAACGSSSEHNSLQTFSIPQKAPNLLDSTIFNLFTG